MPDILALARDRGNGAIPENVRSWLSLVTRHGYDRAIFFWEAQERAKPEGAGFLGY
jgi:hypothetical protein